jgi:hypothetical protein
MKENCIVEKIMWGNTDNTWKPTREYTFKSYEDARVFLTEEKSYQFSYMHKYNLNHIIEDWK